MVSQLSLLYYVLRLRCELLISSVNRTFFDSAYAMQISSGAVIAKHQQTKVLNMARFIPKTGLVSKAVLLTIPTSLQGRACVATVAKYVNSHPVALCSTPSMHMQVS